MHVKSFEAQSSLISMVRKFDDGVSSSLEYASKLLSISPIRLVLLQCLTKLKVAMSYDYAACKSSLELPFDFALGRIKFLERSYRQSLGASFWWEIGHQTYFQQLVSPIWHHTKD
ncbi:hypothetical protein TNCV_3405391 [Trichonephila clavipes]|nr:hypothetical protein TNCV_3405391 [Trichonephila clavipes]